MRKIVNPLPGMALGPKKIISIVSLLIIGGALWATPAVDGAVGQGEYPYAIKVLDGSVTISYAPDRQGGLYLAVSAAATGWVGLGLGSHVMDGAYIFMGYVRDGQAVFSEQQGSGHRHAASPEHRADQSAVGLQGGVTTIEFHIPADKLPFADKNCNFIVAYADAADLSTFHEDNETGGTIKLP